MAASMPVEGTAGETVGAVAKPVPICGLDETVEKAASRARRAGFDRCVVCNDRNVVLGLLGPEELSGSPEQVAADVMSEGPSTYRPMLGVDEARRVMDDDDEDVLIVTTQDGRLVGAVRREDIS